MRTSRPTTLPPAVILAGGFGTRLRAAGLDCPKPMAPVAGKPFLAWLVKYLMAQKVCDFVFSVHHLAERIQDYFGSAWQPDARFRYVREPEPLGTGGALAYAVDQCGLRGEFFVLNGDSITAISLDDMRVAKASRAVDGVILGVEVEDCSRYGSLDVDENGFLHGFREKAQSGGAGLINGGVYLFDSALFRPRAGGKPAAESLERESIPRWLGEGRRFAVARSLGPFIDIGTPESLAQAGAFVRDNPWLGRAVRRGGGS